MNRVLFVAALLCSSAISAQEINPAVTPSNIRATICVSGWTRTVRPPAYVTNAIKAKFMNRQHATGAMRDYELDHITPLELGGAPLDERNLQLQPWPEARRKDAVETALHRQVCNGIITLAAAQAHILRWKP